MVRAGLYIRDLWCTHIGVHLSLLGEHGFQKQWSPYFLTVWSPQYEYLNVRSGTHLCLLELMAEALSARQLSVQNPPGARLDGCAFSQVHPLKGMILIDKLIYNTPLTKWQKHSLSHTPKYRSNYLTVWNYHSHVKDLITFPLVTTVGRALIYLFF